ncbi:hypothetical protein SAMN05661080_00565 [Modestobacter sp. DSM 44400]|uniref:hypothetical protein n=1 Tax=Modestobacter sp. DSM 44400 TaxID=1550230 RepID=UPI00089D9279|nr:hypothetical protein [Modestobacter sp. DSM 44400]SDX60933.1 hypothetical protein SAMN05661080_00565 [Modestobacter sp. DSM 44400]
MPAPSSDEEGGHRSDGEAQHRADGAQHGHPADERLRRPGDGIARSGPGGPAVQRRACPASRRVSTARPRKNELCPACSDQQAGSPFLTRLNAQGDTLAGIYYTVISTTHDEVVTPYQSQFLAGPRRQVTNILVQDRCPDDMVEHDQTPNDPVVHQLVLDALRHNTGPADPAYQPACV